MLVTFEPSKAQLDLSVPNEVENLFDELLSSSIRGYHLIVINRQACQWALDNLDLGHRRNEHLKKLKSDYAQLGALKNQALSSLTITVSDLPLENIGGNHFQIGPKALTSSDYLERSRLVVEHSDNDGKIFGEILIAARKQAAIESIDYEVIHGGGSTIVECFTAQINAKKNVACIFDSDKYTPFDPTSITAKKILDASAAGIFLGCVVETMCREAENFIPPYIIRDLNLCPTYATFPALMSTFEAQSDVQAGECFWLYFDIKLGADAAKLKAIQEPAAKNWIAKKYLHSAASLEDIQVNGFGAGILSVFLRNGQALKEFQNFMKSAYWHKHFHGAFDLLLWVLASSKRSATI